MRKKSPHQFNVPVTLMIFNRPDKTSKTLAEIAKIKPAKLMVIADGPRDRPGEAKRCTAARAIIDSVDWECEVMKNYSDVNLGLRGRVPSGLDWVFGMVEETIILEDDCLPHPTFFRFCGELLEKYRHEKRVMAITGSNYIHGHKVESSYLYSAYSNVWGWASWRRAWQCYDREMKSWSEVKAKNIMEKVLEDKEQAQWYGKLFHSTYKGRINSWAYPWAFTVISHEGLCIVPSVNLISNIGFGDDATHTFSKNSDIADYTIAEQKFPLIHPSVITRDKLFDRKFFEINKKQRQPLYLAVINKLIRSFQYLKSIILQKN